MKKFRIYIEKQVVAEYNDFQKAYSYYKEVVVKTADLRRENCCLINSETKEVICKDIFLTGHRKEKENEK
jgi:hypothetical protein